MNYKAVYFTAFALAFGVISAHAQVVNQAWDGTGTAYASQNDTSGTYNNFATTYDDFTLSSDTTLVGASWVGLYFSPATQAPISSFSIAFYQDNAGTPGSEIAVGSFNSFNETSLGTSTGFPVFSYSVAFLPYTLSAGQYFFSVVANMPFPPEWGWATSTTGDNGAYQNFFGTGSPIYTNNAFSLQQAVPEPSSFALLGVGVLGLGLLKRRA
jgi:hypothetical protein